MEAERVGGGLLLPAGGVSIRRPSFALLSADVVETAMRNSESMRWGISWPRT